MSLETQKKNVQHYLFQLFTFLGSNLNKVNFALSPFAVVKIKYQSNIGVSNIDLTPSPSKFLPLYINQKPFIPTAIITTTQLGN